MPEFTSTAFVQQPERISRTGATFGIDTEQERGQTASGVASEAIATTRRARTPRAAPAQAQSATTTTRSASTMAPRPRVTTSTPSPRPRVTTSTPSSGGGSGGGY